MYGAEEEEELDKTEVIEFWYVKEFTFSLSNRPPCGRTLKVTLLSRPSSTTLSTLSFVFGSSMISVVVQKRRRKDVY